MKKIVFAAVLAFSAAASAQWTVDLPSLWWPDEFTGSQTKAQADAQTIVDSKNVQAYMKQKGLGAIESITALGNNKYLVGSEICWFKVSVRANGVFPIKGTYACGE